MGPPGVGDLPLKGVGDLPGFALVGQAVGHLGEGVVKTSFLSQILGAGEGSNPVTPIA